MRVDERTVVVVALGEQEEEEGWAMVAGGGRHFLLPRGGNEDLLLPPALLRGQRETSPLTVQPPPCSISITPIRSKGSLWGGRMVARKGSRDHHCAHTFPQFWLPPGFISTPQPTTRGEASKAELVRGRKEVSIRGGSDEVQERGEKRSTTGGGQKRKELDQRARELGWVTL